MINSKNELKRKLKECKDKIKFKTIENHCKEGFQVGILRDVGGKIQTNAFTIKTKKENGEIVDSWVYYEHIDVANNIITYKDVPIKIEIIEVEENEKEI